MAVGVGRWPTALVLVAVALAAVLGLRVLEERLVPSQRRDQRDLYVVVDDSADASDVQRHLREHGVEMIHISMVELGSRIGLDLIVAGSHADKEAALAGVTYLPSVRYASDERGSASPPE